MPYNYYDKDFSTVAEIASFAQMYGNTDDLFIVNKFAQNLDIDSDTPQDIWLRGGTRDYPGAAETFNVTSSSADDTSDGTGTRSAEITSMIYPFGGVPRRGETKGIATNSVIVYVAPNTYPEKTLI